jgi:hypothetical protein
MRYRGFSAVFNWLAKKDEDGEALLAQNPMRGLKPKTDEAPIHALSLDDARRLLDACKGPNLLDKLLKVC